MEFYYIEYRGKGKPPRYILLLYLGQKGNKICGIDSSVIPDHERAKIIDNKKVLSSMANDRRYLWLKEHCPIACKTGYKEIYLDNLTIQNRYRIGE